MADVQPALGNLKHDLQWRANRIREAIEEADERQTHVFDDGTEIEYKSVVSYLDDQDTVVVFFTLATETIKIAEKAVFEKEFLREGYRDGVIAGYVGDSRRDTFDRYDIWDDKLRAKVKQTSDCRNALVHDPHSTLKEMTIEELDENVETAIEAVDGMTALLY